MIRPLEQSSTVFSLGDSNLHTLSKVVTFLCPYMVILQTVNVRVTKMYYGRIGNQVLGSFLAGIFF